MGKEGVQLGGSDAREVCRLVSATAGGGGEKIGGYERCAENAIEVAILSRTSGENDGKSTKLLSGTLGRRMYEVRSRIHSLTESKIET